MVHMCVTVSVYGMCVCDGGCVWYMCVCDGVYGTCGCEGGCVGVSLCMCGGGD